MLRIVTSLIRNAPGPLRGPRALAADLVEGLLDVVSPPPEVIPPPPAPPPASPATVDDAPRPRVVEAPEPEAAAPAEEAPAKAEAEPTEEAPTQQVDADEAAYVEAYKQATAKAALVRRQDFKVLAIFWEAFRRNTGPMTAKQAAALAGELGMTIRHENVRKVIRTRLTDHIETSTVENSQPPTFEYELKESGSRFFETEYLAKFL